MKQEWQKDLINSIDSLDKLKELQKDSFSDKLTNNTLQPNETKFKFKVPEHFANLVQEYNIDDPILKQFLPRIDENINTPGYTNDPLEEYNFTKIPGLIHKYKSRVLLIVTGTCAINCRYCFRREYPYANNTLSKYNLDQALEYINNDKNINEVILSGGDPLVANDTTLKNILLSLSRIDNIKTIRFHTRIPVVMPSRITDSFIKILSNIEQKILMVLHTNHPREISKDVTKALSKLNKNGITLLNQSVLLKGVNDCAKVLQQLSEKLFSVNVIPYYLHMLDKVSGTSHFYVDINTAKIIYQLLQHNLAGYLVPKLVIEEPHAKSKTVL